METTRITVVKFSDSFSDLWPALAQDLGAQSIVVEDCDDCELEPAALDSAAIVLAAGGAEPQVLDWLSRHEAPVGIPLFAVGSDPGRRIAIQVVSQGARDYFALPEDIETLQNSLASAIERHRQAMRRSARRGEEAKNGAFSEIVGESDALKLLLDRASRILHHADATLLIIGETGTGKELIARAIHDGGPRRGSPFVAVNCSALPDRLIESELFGHERGAFTDARAPKPGLFEVAEGGTLFLDEIGDLPVELQAKFLRVLQDKQVRRVGGTKWRKVDVRIIAATNEDLSAAMKNGSFRQDLYYRLSVITLALPPLRERGDDVLLIAEGVLGRLAKQHGLEAPSLDAAARRALQSYHWPGNVRELKNSMERALLLSQPGELNCDELLSQTESLQPAPGPVPFPAQLSEITRSAARAMVEISEGNRSRAASRLGISRRRLRRLLEIDGVS